MVLLRKEEQLIYQNRMISDREEDRDDFYELLSYLKNNSVDVVHQYEGNFYSTFTYTLEDGGIYVYQENDEQGIPYSLKCIEPSKELEVYQTEQEERV